MGDASNFAETAEPFFSSQRRGTVYAFLSSLFRDEPEKNAVETFFSSCNGIKPAGREPLPDRPITSGSSNTAETGDAAETALSQFRKAWSETISESDYSVSLKLRREYALLFLTPWGVRPYESIYRGMKKRLMDDPWVEVRDFYRAVGMEKGDDEDHPEDHLAVELGFMSYLSFLEAEQSDRTKKGKGRTKLVNLQSSFLTQHLLQWFPALCRDIQSVSEIPFYHAAAGFTEAYIREDDLTIQNRLGKNRREDRAFDEKE